MTAFLFSDIEGSTRLWESHAEQMQAALARHDALSRAAVERHRGSVVKMTGDGLHAAFDSGLDAIEAMLAIQLALDAPPREGELALRVRCGAHLGPAERRAGDFFGPAVNRAARVAAAAHGGQMLVTQAIIDEVSGRLPAGVTLRSLGAVRLRDLARPEQIWQVEHPRLRSNFPALRSLEATPNNLPQQLSSFIGRERELNDGRRLLKSNRLVTLFGAGGIGKSRLSLQLAAESMDDFADGVWCVELAPLTEAQRVAQAVASVLGVKEEAGRPVSEALAKHVVDRRLLIVLDNCEHLIDACAALAKQLLQAGPQVKVLATSRELLRIGGEAVYDVPALSVPDAHTPLAPHELMNHEAVHLFADRAAAAQPAFRISEGNAAAVADICRRLDGLPLAIELAAARARALSVEAIAARLGDRMRLLATRDQTVLPRQQTLRALIDWSHDLLVEPERALFRRLALFAGGWTLEAAEAVGSDARDDVLDLLSRLVEKSLVVLQADGARYRLLDTVRQYAEEKLAQAVDEAATRERHAAFFVGLAEAARPQLSGPDQGSWLVRLDLEQENMLTALAWRGHEANGAQRALRLVFALRPYWINRGLFDLGHRLTNRTLALPGAQAHDLHRCRALHVAGQLSFIMGRYGEAEQHLHASLAIAAEIGDAERRAAALQPLGMACVGQGDLARARPYLEEAVSLARSQGNKRQLVAATNTLAQLHRIEGDVAAAEPLYDHVLVLARELGDQQSIAIALLNLAILSIGRSQVEAAQRMLVEAISIAEQIGSKLVQQSALDVCAGLCAVRSDWPQAALFFGAAEAQAQSTGFRRQPEDDAFLSPLVARTWHALGVAEFAAAEAGGRTLVGSEALTRARAWLEAAGG